MLSTFAKQLFILEIFLFEQTPPNSKKMGSKSEKKEFTNIFTRFFQHGHLKYLDVHKMRAKVQKSLLISVNFVVLCFIVNLFGFPPGIEPGSLRLAAIQFINFFPNCKKNVFNYKIYLHEIVKCICLKIQNVSVSTSKMYLSLIMKCIFLKF